MGRRPDWSPPHSSPRTVRMRGHRLGDRPPRRLCCADMPLEPEISIVLPVFNEEGHVGDEIKRISASMEESGIPFELIVIDDGSSDRSSEIARSFEHVRLIRFNRNRGSGTARRVGTHMARGSVVVWTDADMSYPNDQIPWLVEHLKGFDQVVGARSVERGTLRVLRVPAKWLIRKLAEYLTGTKIPDLNSGFRAFRRDVALQFLHLLPTGFSCVTTLTMTFLANGYEVGYVPIEYAKRSGESKFHWWSDTRRYLLQVVRLVVLYNPLRFFMPLAVGMIVTGLVKVPFDIFRHDFRVANSTQILLLAGLMVALLGMLADLIVMVNRSSVTVDSSAWSGDLG